jgi:hypothetical protein
VEKRIMSMITIKGVRFLTVALMKGVAEKM